MSTGYVAYDATLTVELEGGQALSNMVLVSHSFEPTECSIGDEEYTVIESQIIRLSYLLSTCDAEILLTAQVWRLTTSVTTITLLMCHEFSSETQPLLLAKTLPQLLH